MRIVQALHWLQDMLGSDRPRIVAQLQRVLEDRAHGDTLRADLQQGLATLPTWMQSVVREVLDAKVQTARRSRSRRRGDQINAG